MILPVAPFGYKMIGIGLGMAVVLGLVARSWAAASLGLAFALFSVYFFRDPERQILTDPDVAYSPGDGRVLSVGREGPGETQTLRIFLSVWDVHVQRVPLQGRVEKIDYQKGSFKIASADEARLNERNAVTLGTDHGTVVVEQIAGFVARRIRCYLQEGEEVRQGQRLGIIYFGSQAALACLSNQG